MSKERGAWTNWLMNVALLALGLVVLVLVYGLVTRSFTPRTDPVREANPANLVGDILQVEVRNGCGVSGLAAEMTRFLRNQGFDVVEVGDHTVFDLEQSVVVDRVGDLEAAKKVAASIGLPEDRVKQDISQDYYLDASVIIGKDYETLTPFAAK